MSLLRLLSPSRTAGRSSSASACPNTVTADHESDQMSLTIRMPNYACIYMTPPDDPLWPLGVTPDLPRNDELVHGELDVLIPPTGGPRRCKAIRVIYRCMTRLNMGPTRGWENDLIFERRCELAPGSSEGIALTEGLTRFSFTIILPSTLAPHDWHHDGKLSHEVIAEIEGLPASKAWNPFRTDSRTQSPARSITAVSTPRSGLSRSPSPPSSSSPPPIPLTLGIPEAYHRRSPPLASTAHSLSVIQQDPAMPRAPSYGESQADSPQEEGKWIKGTITARRAVVIFYNPSRTNESTSLDERENGLLPGLGPYEFQLSTHLFGIGAPLQFGLKFLDVPAATTILHAQLLLLQTHAIQSPRDNPADVPPRSSTRRFTLYQSGPLPDVSKPPAAFMAPAVALWRGITAGGSDCGQCIIESIARMPQDDQGRPSTLPGVNTPIRVSHEFLLEVLFTYQGEDRYGRPTQGPAELRIMRIKRPIIVPSCALIPSRLSLPPYDDTLTEISGPCPACGIPPEERFCRICPPTILPHGRHDVDLAPCDTCNSDRLFTEDSADYGNPPLPCSAVCACGAGVGELAERMKAFALGDAGVADDAGGTPAVQGKEQEERGRTRGRSQSRT